MLGALPFLVHAAKPIIDVNVIVARESVAAATTVLTRVGGYEYKGEWGIPDQHAFRKVTKPSRNLYVCVKYSAALSNHLSVRDLLRVDEELRAEYALVKLKLAEQQYGDVEDYCEAKNDVLQHILEKAGMGLKEREKIKKAKERVMDAADNEQI